MWQNPSSILVKITGKGINFVRRRVNTEQLDAFNTSGPGLLVKIWRLDQLGSVLLKSEINRACAFHSVHSYYKIQTTTDELMFVTPAIPSTIFCVSLSNV